MAEQSSEVSTQHHPQVDRQQIIKKLCSQGFGITFETAVTLHKCELLNPTEEHTTEANGSGASASTSAATEQQWQIVDYGIPVVIAESGTLQLRIHDVTSGEMLRRFSLTEDSCYSEMSSHFHAFVDCTRTQDVDKVHCFGISTPDEAVAKKIITAVKRIIPLADRSLSELGVPPPKRGRFENEGESYDDWVIIEPSDLLEDQAESMVMDDGGNDDDETDSALGVRLRTGTKRRRRSQEKTRSLIISEPKEFRHIAHVGQDTSVSNMTKAMSVDISQSQDISSSILEPGTEETTSLNFVPQGDLPVPPPVGPPAPVPPPPPPVVKPPAPVILGKKSSGTGTLKPSQSQNPVVSLDEILKKRGTLRPVRGQKIVPEPPPKPDRTKLVSDINTFDRNTLKHIEHKKDKDSTDVDDPNCLQSILRASLEKMREKLTTDFSQLQIGNVDSKGDEYGFGDECDGPLFAEK